MYPKKWDDQIVDKNAPRSESRNIFQFEGFVLARNIGPNMQYSKDQEAKKRRRKRDCCGLTLLEMKL